MKRIFVTAALIVALAGCTAENRKDFTGSGTIEATEVTVSAQARGEITALNVEEGTTIAKDAVIATIDTEESALQKTAAEAGLEELAANKTILRRELDAAGEAVKQAAATLANTEKNRARFANLLADNAATAEQVDRIGTEYELAVSRKRAAEKQLDVLKSRIGALDTTHEKIERELAIIDKHIADGVVTAPLDGVVIDTFVERGEVVNYGSPVCTVADLKNVWLMIYVGEEDMGKITLGQKAKVRIDSFPGRDFAGAVAWLSQKAEFTPKNVQTKESRVDLVYAVKIVIDNSEGVFKIGMPADASIEGLE